MASSRRRRIAYVAAALAALVLATIVIVPVLVPRRTVRRLVVHTLDRGCGCRVLVNGRFALTLWPGPELLATRLRVADPPGFAPQPLVRVARVALRASWADLLVGRWVLTSVRLERVVVALSRNARGESNLAAFLHPGFHPSVVDPSPHASTRVHRAAVSSALFAVFGRLVVRGLDVVEEPGARRLLSVSRLSLGPEGHRGLPVALQLAAPGVKTGPITVSLAGRIVTTNGRRVALDLAALRLRAPSFFPGPLTAGKGNFAYRPIGREAHIRISPITLADPRLGQAGVRGTIDLQGATIARAAGAVRLRIRSGFVRRELPELRPRVGPSGLHAALTFSEEGSKIGPAPFTLAWAGHGGRARLQGRLTAMRRAGRWCWRLQAQGTGVGFHEPSRPSSSSSRRTSPRASSRVTPRRPRPVARDASRSGMCLTLAARLSALALDGVPVPRLRLRASLEGRRLFVPMFAAELFGGTLHGQARGRLLGQRLRALTGRVTFRNVELSSLHSALDPKAGGSLAGRVSGTATLAARGGLALRRWRGEGAVTGSGLVWRGIDLAALLRALATTVRGHPPTHWPSGGTTPLGTLQGSWALASEQVNLRGVVLESPLLHVSGGGHVGLAGSGRLDLTLDLAPGPRADARTWPPALRGVVIPVRVRGSLTHPLPLPDVPALLHRLLRRRLGHLLGGFLKGA